MGFSDQIRNLVTPTNSTAERAFRNQLPVQVKELQRLADKYHLAKFLPYRGYDRENKIYKHRDSMGFVVELGVQPGSNHEQVLRLQSVINAIPENTFVQVSMYASPDIHGKLALWAFNRQAKGESEDQSCRRAPGMYRTVARERYEYFKDANFKSLWADQTLVLRDFRCYLSVQQPTESNVEIHTEKLIRLRSEMMEAFASAAVPSRIVEVTEFVNLIDTILNPSDSPKRNCIEYNDLEYINEQVMSAQTVIKVEDDHLEINDTAVAMYTVRSYPVEFGLMQMFNAIGDMFVETSRIPGPFIITQGFRVKSRESAIAMAAVREQNAKRYAGSPAGKLTDAFDKNAKDWGHVADRLAEGAMPVEMYHEIVTYCSPCEVANMRQKLNGVFTSLRWHIVNDRALQLQGLLSALPGALDDKLMQDRRSMRVTHNLLSDNVLNTLPICAEIKGSRSPFLSTISPLGQLQFFDHHDSETNYNSAIIAPSGGGKTVLSQELTYCHLSAGGVGWIIDHGYSNHHSAKLWGGEFWDFKQGCGKCINPFSRIYTIDQLKEQMETLKPLASIMTKPKEGTTDIEDAILEICMTEAWKAHGRDTTFTIVNEVLLQFAQDHQELRTVALNLSMLLKSYCKGGKYEEWFEGENNLDFNNRLIVLELSGLDSDLTLRQIALNLMMNTILTEMSFGSKSIRKLCTIDEAWNLLDTKNAKSAAHAAFIESGYRTCRKYNGAFTTITQNAFDYQKNTQSMACWENAEYKIYLKHKSGDVDAYLTKELPGMSEGVAKMLRSLHLKKGRYSELMIQSAAGAYKTRMVLDPFSVLTYSSQGDDVWVKDTLRKHGASEEGAIRYLTKLRGLMGWESDDIKPFINYAQKLIDHNQGQITADQIMAHSSQAFVGLSS